MVHIDEYEIDYHIIGTIFMQVSTRHTTRTRTVNSKDAATDTGDLIGKVDVFTQTEAEDVITRTGASSENYD